MSKPARHPARTRATIRVVALLSPAAEADRALRRRTRGRWHWRERLDRAVAPSMRCRQAPRRWRRSTRGSSRTAARRGGTIPRRRKARARWPRLGRRETHDAPSHVPSRPTQKRRAVPHTLNQPRGGAEAIVRPSAARWYGGRETACEGSQSKWVQRSLHVAMDYCVGGPGLVSACSCLFQDSHLRPRRMTPSRM